MKTTSEAGPTVRRVGVIGRVAVGYDGSPQSVAAVRWASDLAHLLGATLTVAAAANPYSAEVSPEDDELFLSREHAEIAAELDEVGVIDRVLQVRDVSAERLLTEVAEDHDVLVLGTKSSPGWTRHGYFSLTHQLAHVVSCPMIVVPGEEHGPPSVTDGVVVGVDGSEGNRAALDWACALAGAVGAPVTATYATDPMYDTFDAAGWYGADEVAARAEASNAIVTFEERPGGHPADVLEQVVDQVGAGLLVVGAKWRHALGGYRLGAVPSELLHRPTCPIAVVSHDYEERHS